MSEDSRVAALKAQIRQMDRIYNTAKPEQQLQIRRNKDAVNKQLAALRSLEQRRGAGAPAGGAK
jgi:hypothetical protein